MKEQSEQLNLQVKTLSVPVGDKTLVFETGKIARQAGGSVMVHCGETTILGTACASSAPLEDVDFLPLRIDYQEKFSAAGKTLGGFIKREGRPTERETLVCRLIDRPLRPLFEEGYYHEIQVLSYVYSYDNVNKPDVLAICAASAALVISDIPLLKPISGVRVGMIDGSFVLNPSEDEIKKSKLDLILAGTEDAILMIEGYADFLTDEQVVDAIDFGHEAIRVICKALAGWQKEVGKTKNLNTLKKIPEALLTKTEEIITPYIEKALTVADKKEREQVEGEAFAALEETLISKEESEYTPKELGRAFKKVSSALMRKRIIDKKIRVDGRKLDQVRPIAIEHGLLPRTHGSALFTRGETQSIAVCTLGGETMGQRYENLHGEGLQRFYMQYFFPPFSVGEVGRMGPAGRREVGHGKLAERALMAALPTQDQFPYVIRVESNITESNGSSSMASVCGGCLAMMDAGIPIERPVSGIAMGLILQDNQATILSDILGMEDALGDMDFKVTGDGEGITAFQMDIKVEGITLEILKEALAQAKQGCVHILGEMKKVLPEYNKEMSTYAPKIFTMKIKPNKIGAVIGSGGKQIRSIIEETGVEIDISDEGKVSITSNDQKAIDQAKEIIRGLTEDVELGKVYRGKITSITKFGLFVEVLPGKEGLCPKQEIAFTRIDNLNDLYKEGDFINVKVIDIDERGRVRLSHKALLSDIAQV
jgi:polyribonucleotide nucleotidyltransferase